MVEEEKAILKTDVDDFLELVKRKGRISLPDAAKDLNVPLATVTAWTDFLVEEKIVGIEYKFTTPFVFIQQEAEKTMGIAGLGFDTKEQFYEKARKRGIAESQIRLLWLKYLNVNKEAMKKVFFDKAREKGMPQGKAALLWQKYYSYLQEEEVE